MNGHEVTITLGKGGVDKSTTTTTLAYVPASLEKKEVCSDLDIGIRNLDVVMGFDHRTIYDLLDAIKDHCRLTQGMIRDCCLAILDLKVNEQTRDKTATSPWHRG